jgi:hypothetical protein
MQFMGSVHSQRSQTLQAKSTAFPVREFQPSYFLLSQPQQNELCCIQSLIYSDAFNLLKNARHRPLVTLLA